MVDGGQYGRVAAAWLVAALVPPMLAVGLIAVWISRVCEPDSVDCSWGLEYLLAVPVLVLSWLVLAPLAVYLVLRGDPTAASTGRWTALTAWVSLVVAGPLVLAAAPHLTVAVGLATALASRWWVVRRAGAATGG